MLPAFRTNLKNTMFNVTREWSLFDEDGDFDINELSKWDIVLRMTDKDVAKREIDAILKNACFKYPKQVLFVFYEFIRGHRRHGIVGGGANTDPVDTKDLDPRLFKLMELVDSLHDCKYEHRDFVLESLGVDVNVDLPKIVIRAGARPAEVKKVGIETLAAWERFHNMITSVPTLRFGTEDVGNPMWRARDFMRQETFKWDDDINVASDFERFLKTDATDMWCMGEKDLEIFQLAQVARVCSAIRAKFGADPTRGNNITFLPDNSDFVMRIILGLTVIYNDIKTRLDKGNESPAQLMREALDGKSPSIEVPDLTEAEAAFARAKGLDAKWTCRSCDASMMDAAHHDCIVHEAATGDVFHPQSAVQVTLRGATVRDDSYPVQEYDFDVSSKVAAVEPTTPDREKVSKTVYSMLDDTKGYAWTSWYWGDSEVDHSKDHMNSTLKTLKGIPATLARLRNGAVALAMKRAGDWGMIQHCKRYGMVFVTTDRFAALYAAYRGVCVIHMKVAKIRIPKYDGTKRKDQQVPAKAEFVQYAFSFFATDAGVTALKFFPDDVPQPIFQTGGAACAILRNVALAGLTLAMAVFGSAMA